MSYSDNNCGKSVRFRTEISISFCRAPAKFMTRAQTHFAGRPLRIKKGCPAMSVEAGPSLMDNVIPSRADLRGRLLPPNLCTRMTGLWLRRTWKR